MATSYTHGAAASGQVTPGDDNARRQPGVRGHKEQAHGVSLCDCATDTHDRKEFATLRAVAALAGVELYKLPEGGYLASRWNVSRELCELPDLQAVREWLARVGSRP